MNADTSKLTNNKRLIVVLGMHRSGTSAVTRGLPVMGVELGNNLLPPQKDNVTGFWEDSDLNALNMEMLDALGTKWDSITPPQDSELDALLARGYLERAVRLLKQKTSGVAIFGFKDPRTAKLLRFWKEVFTSSGLKTGYIVAVRNPLSVYRSLEKRRGLGIEQTSLLWLEHTINSLAGTTGEDRVIVDYDHLMTFPEIEIQRIAKRLDLQIIPAELEKFNTEFLSRELQHTTYQLDDLLQNEAIHPLTKDIYSTLLNVVQSNLSLDDRNLQEQVEKWKTEFSRLRPILAYLERLESEHKILIREKDADIQKLEHWLKNSETGVQELLKSNRWKIGNRIGEAWLRVRGRQHEPLVTDYLASVFQRAHEWEQRRAFVEQQPTRTFPQSAVDIVICVHNALEDVKSCLDSIEKNTDSRHKLILVDDGSEDSCREYLSNYASQHESVTLIRNEAARGYTVAANQGLHCSKAEYVVLLNSDTIVTSSWLENLLECAESAPKIGIIGPLSNAASWQSIPQLFDSNRDWSINPLPPGWNPPRMADLVRSYSHKEFPRVPLLNGFCLAIKRRVIETIGYLDEQTFPEGYGEENDYCLRAVDAGFELAVADHVYIYHAKSKSYSHDRRRALSSKYAPALVSKHGQQRIDRDVLTLRQHPVLQKSRERVSWAIKNLSSKSITSPATAPAKNGVKAFSVLFVLPIAGWGGGIHSIIQEATTMQTLGANVKIAVPKNELATFQKNYPKIENISNVLYGFDSLDQLIDYSSSFQVVIGTIYHSMQLIHRIASSQPGVMPAYYIQDYEPLFFDKDTREWKEAHQSYTLIKNALLFAKTNWLREVVGKEHDVQVEKVLPSLDHGIYFPSIIMTRRAKWPVRIAAMIRPSSPRRAPQRTLRVLKQAKQKFGPRVEIHLFGCQDQEFATYGLDHGFEYENHGELIREEVANLLRQSDIFVDFSDYQAFGRTGIEAMACGCAVVLPKDGGVHEFAIHHVNSLIVNSKHENECYAAIEELVESQELRLKLQQNALEKVQEYSPLRAARSELSLFTRKYIEFIDSKRITSSSRRSPKRASQELRMVGVLSRTAKGFVGSAYIRLIQPLTHPSLKGKLTFEPGTLSEIYANPPDAVIAQRIAISEEDEAHKLVEFCQSNNVKLIYELDDDLFEIGSSGSSHPEAEKYAQWIRGAKILALNADLVTVSSENLKSKLLNLNPNIHVIPNALDERIWQIGDSSLPLRNSSDEQIGVLYMGTKTHNQDLELIKEALSKIKSKSQNRVRFDIIGVSSDKLDGRLFNVINIPPDTAEYPEFVRWMVKHALSWSIGLAPLLQTSFNECKSYIKFLDYSALGLASICSTDAPYEAVVTNGINGLLVENTTEVWYEALERLIKDSELRETICRSAHRNLHAHHTLETQSESWWEAYTSLFVNTKEFEHSI